MIEEDGLATKKQMSDDDEPSLVKSKEKVAFAILAPLMLIICAGILYQPIEQLIKQIVSSLL